MPTEFIQKKKEKINRFTNCCYLLELKKLGGKEDISDRGNYKKCCNRKAFHPQWRNRIDGSQEQAKCVKRKIKSQKHTKAERRSHQKNPFPR